MTLEESAALEAVNGQKASKNSSKGKKEEVSESDIAAAGGKTSEYFEEQGQKSKDNKAQGGKEVEVSLINKTLVRFTKNFGFFLKGHGQEVSDVAYAIYDKAGVIEKL